MSKKFVYLLMIMGAIVEIWAIMGITKQQMSAILSFSTYLNQHWRIIIWLNSWIDIIYIGLTLLGAAQIIYYYQHRREQPSR